MIAAIPLARLFRRRGEGEDRVAFIELFFDLVFVLAVTQLAHHVVDHLDPRGMLEGLVMLIAIWWVWMYTTWVTNWMDPQRSPVRVMLIALMLLGLVLSTSIPEAFGDRALGFAAAYLAMQLGRSIFVAVSYALAGDRVNALNLARISLWFCLSGPFWIAGAIIGGDAQLAWWAVAIAIDLAGPILRYWVPVLRTTPIESWQVSGAHMAERSGLFMIIALGESIIITGSQFSDNELTSSSILAFLAAFVGTILFWLLYFSHGAEHGARFIDAAAQTGAIARLTYTYIHILLVGGVVLLAVGDELVLAHPDDPLDLATLAIVTAAPALYLLGNLLFKRSIGRPWLRSHLAGMAALVVVFALGLTVPEVTPLALTWITNGVLAIVTAIDELTWRRDEREAGIRDDDEVVLEPEDSAGPQ
jgi:low temperature requirement protein LtrA